MTGSDEKSSTSSDTFSAEQRAAAFAPPMTAAERTAALRAGRTPVPPKFIMWMIAAFAVLGLGGGVVEHFFGSVGVSTTTTTAFTLNPTPTTPAGPQLNSTLSAFIGLKQISSALASPFTLLDQANSKWSVSKFRGKVVVLTFYSANCNDICPVLGAEIKQAQAQLGAKTDKVVFAIVNTDPNHFHYSAQPMALTVPHLFGVPSVYFLTGALNQLNAIWINYGVTVKVGAKANQVAHNNVMYFIDPQGDLRSLAVPFGNENHAGIFALRASDIQRFSKGMAQTVSSLVK